MDEQKVPTTTLYVGNLNREITEEFLMTLFSPFGSIKSCKLYRDENPYAFIEFDDQKIAETARATMMGRNCMGKQMRINWASSAGGSIHPKQNTANHYHVFVGDLSSDITEEDLRSAFGQFGTISDCRVLRDPFTYKSKGYGFVSFAEKSAAETAIVQMNGYWLKTRSIRTNWALRKPGVTDASDDFSDQQKKISNSASATNSTVFCGNIITGLSETLLRNLFSQFGSIVEIRTFNGKGYGFVKFLEKSSAVKAIVEMNQKEVNGALIKVSWGKESNHSKNDYWTSAAESFAGHGSNAYGYGYSYLGSSLGPSTYNPNSYLNLTSPFEMNTSGNSWNQAYSHPVQASAPVTVSPLQQQYYMQSLMQMYGYPYNYGFSMQTQPTTELSNEERTSVNGNDD